MQSTIKRLLALILALSMCLSLLSANVWAAGSSGDASGDVSVQEEASGEGSDSSADGSESKTEDASASDTAEAEEVESKEDQSEPEEEEDEKEEKSLAEEEPAEEPEQTPAETPGTSKEKTPKETAPEPQEEPEESLQTQEEVLRPQEAVSYRGASWDSNNNEVVYSDSQAGTCTVVGSDTTGWGAADTETWYVVNTPSADALTITERITVSGTVNLILCDGAKLSCKGITLTSGNTLNIFAQSEGEDMGELVISDVAMDNAGIGGGEHQTSGELVIHGGKVTVRGGHRSAGIGGGGSGSGNSGSCGDVTIYGGQVTATGGAYGAGIGGSSTAAQGGTITIYGGTVTASDSSDCGAGIGGGGTRSSSGAGAGGRVDIYGGTVTATSNSGGAGIGGGGSSNASSSSSSGGRGGDVTIYGGTVTAISRQGGAGIGGGYSYQGGAGSGGTVTINGGTVTATSTYNSAGIGGGYGSQGGAGSGGTVIINGGTVTATGNNGGAGIGGATCYPRGSAGGSAGANVTINGGTVIATGSILTTSWGEQLLGMGIGGGKGNGSHGALNVAAGMRIETSADNKTWENTTSTPNTRKRYMRVTFPTITYLVGSWDSTEEKLSFAEASVAPGEYIVVDPSAQSWGTEGTESWYVVGADMTAAQRVTVNGTVHLILCDKATLTAEKGIHLPTNSTLNIYAESDGQNMGALLACTNADALNGAGIGGNGNESGGTLNLHGGTVTATGGNASGSGSAGIGSGSGGQQTKSVTIYGGSVTATGGSGGAGIGGGKGGGASNIIIYGGTVTTAGGADAQGIGKGETSNPVEGTLSLGRGVTMEASTDNAAWRAYDGSTRTQYMRSTYDSHVHQLQDYTVSDDGMSLTAVCTEDECPLPEVDGAHTASLTILAPTTGGLAATLSGDAKAFRAYEADIEYSSKQDVTWSSTVPTGDGFYHARLIVKEAGDSTQTHPLEVAYGVNTITKTATTNGSFEVPSIATVTATVTIETTPDTGYELDTLTVVTTEGSSPITVTPDGNKGSFVMPEENVTVSATFKKSNYAVTISDTAHGSVSASKDGNPVSETNPANYQDTITLTCTADEYFALKSIEVKDSGNAVVALSGEGDTRSFTMPASPVTVTAVFEGQPFAVTTVIEPDNGGTAAVSGAGVTITSDETTAKAGSEVTLTTTPTPGYGLDSVTVTTAGGEDVALTGGKFTMPTEAVTVSATFVTLDMTATLKTTGSGGTAALLRDDYSAIEDGKVTKKTGEKFLLCINSDEDHDYALTCTPGGTSVSIEGVSEEENKDYLAYAKANHISISPETILLRVTMPGVNGGNLNLNLAFSELHPYTILYQSTSGNPDAVWCRFTTRVNNQDMDFVVDLNHTSELGGVSVWSAQVTAAFNPTKIAFAEAYSDLETAVMQNAVVRQSAVWTDIDSDKYLIIGGNARAVVAAFVSDPEAVAFYDSEKVAFTGDSQNSGASYQIAVCKTDNSGTVTEAGTVTAPEAPSDAPKGKEFDGWSGYYFENAGEAATGHIYSAGEDIPMRENATFSPVWKSKTLSASLNPNNGSGTSDKSVSYGDKLSPETPTKKYFVLDGWQVKKAVMEGDTFFDRGADFDFDTALTNDLELAAHWKHVHSYTCYQFSDFGNELSAYQSYAAQLHVGVCGCYDYVVEPHSFNSSGLCACGYQKPEVKVTMKVSYGSWNGTDYTQKLLGQNKTALKDHEVSVSAPYALDEDMVFSKWQYSTDESTWKDLSADRNVAFAIPCDLEVRALYINPIREPEVELSASAYQSNVLFQMHYRLPEGCTLVDAGVRLGDNVSIAYYELKEVKRSTGSKVAQAGLAIGFSCLSIFSGLASPVDAMANAISNDPPKQYYWAERENSVLNELSAASLSDYMMNYRSVNVEFYVPYYWGTCAKTRGACGSVRTVPPQDVINQNNGRHYVYGMAYLTYQQNGKTKTIHTQAIPTTQRSIPDYTVKATPNGMSTLQS